MHAEGAGEANIHLPPLQDVSFFGGSLSSYAILYFGLAVCVVGAIFGFFQYKQTRALPVHKAMADVSNIIWETCKTYLFTQGKFIMMLWAFIAVVIMLYFGVLQHLGTVRVGVILLFSERMRELWAMGPGSIYNSPVGATKGDDMEPSPSPG